MMNIYQELGLNTIINASDTYTRLGGSRMSDRTLKALTEAGQYFVDLSALSDAVCSRIAQRTGNQSAFISSGAGACVVLAASSCLAGSNEELMRQLPNASNCPKNEIIIFRSQKECPILPYWQLIGLSGASIITAEDDLISLEKVITSKTAAIFIFAGSVYQRTAPPEKDIIALAHRYQIPVIVDAAAQLPPKELMSYYTLSLGADAVIFSGGKFINGPQTTGLILGSRHIVEPCKALANPNVRIGRPYKVGKEEYIALYRACMDFLDSDDDARYNQLLTILQKIQAGLAASDRYYCYLENHGRLGQKIPMLYLQFTDGTASRETYDYLYSAPNPIDVGVFHPEDPTGDPCRIFINAINLREHELPVLIAKLNQWINSPHS